MTEILEGFVPYRSDDVELYLKKGWWKGTTLGTLLDRAADMHPDKEAFIDTTSRYTYGEAREKTDKLALSLIDLGIKPLDRVMIQLPNWAEFVFVFFACQKIGAITVLLTDRYRQFEISQAINMTEATHWILPTAYRKTDYVPIIEDVSAAHPELKNIITVRGKLDQSNCSCLDDLLEAGETTDSALSELARRNPDPMQVAHMGLTGGTTGEPKIVPRIHNSLACGVEHCSLSWDQHCEDVNLIVGPIGHDLSFSKGFLGSIITHGKIVFLDNTSNQVICETIEKEKVTSIIWVPILAKRMLEYDDLETHDLSSLKKMHSAGGASHPGLVKDVMEKLKMRFYNGYGATEGMTTITRTEDNYKAICYTVGRPTFPYDIYKVVDAKNNELPLNTPGELLVKGPSMFSGYYNSPEENELTFTSDGFFLTGDIAKIDEKGYITITGRIKEMINRGGESISSTTIEKLIIQHPRVELAAVVAMPDPDMGEKACAYIQPKAGESLSFDDIIDFLKEKKAAVLELPERIEFIDVFPLTKTHKLDKKKLKVDIEDKLKHEGKL
jgi:non-ribosomal peptide synthetase component E (peptide arylation enzyme)